MIGINAPGYLRQFARCPTVSAAMRTAAGGALAVAAAMGLIVALVILAATFALYGAPLGARNAAPHQLCHTTPPESLESNKIIHSNTYYSTALREPAPSIANTVADQPPSQKPQSRLDDHQSGPPPFFRNCSSISRKNPPTEPTSGASGTEG